MTILKMNKKAYLDPGFGTTILSTMWYLIAAIFLTAVAFIVKHFWKPIKKFFSGK